MEFVPYVISWNLTQRCNLRCEHCYIDASAAMPGELSTDEALRVLDEIAEVNRELILILTGGEPLLRADLDQLVARAAQLGMTVVLGTNGALLTARHEVRTGQTVSFLALVSGEAAAGPLTWQFGEGFLWMRESHALTCRACDHIYEKPGAYEISAEVPLMDGETIELKTDLRVR